jgi:hypothetical protein
LALTALLVAGGWSGCLLDTGTINKRPKVQVKELPEALHRGTDVTFSADITDPNDKLEVLKVEWHVGETHEAANASSPLSCEGQVKQQCRYTVPAGTKSEVLYVVVQVTDPYSATASGFRDFPIENRAPVAKLDLTAPANSSDHYPLLTNFVFSAKNSNDDDPGDQDRLGYSWKVTYQGQPISPSGCGDASKPDSCSFTAENPGKYQVILTVKDPSLAVSAPATMDLVVDEDRPPCIRSYSPPVLDKPVMFASQNNTFAVIMVEDDVNPFPVGEGAGSSPKTPGTFKWSSRTNLSDDFTRISTTSNQFPFSQSWFNVGDWIQIRVEYQDGKHSLASCDPNATVCSLNRDNCVQWITWTVIFQ